MKISKLFHWLYTLLMLLPFIALIYNFFGQALSQTTFNALTFTQVVNMINVPTFTAISSNINDCFVYLVNNLFGFSGVVSSTITDILTYWVIVSVIWIIFDVLMFVPFLIHRMIDKFVGAVQ